jgi:hypothetical protein
VLTTALPFVVLLPFAAAQVSLPGAGGQRFVDFSQDLAMPGTIVVVGTLTRWKEGKRERLADGQLGGGGQVASVSGTQYFKVPVTASLQARTTFHGKPENVTLAFDVQLARLPDGKERRQMAGGVPIEEDRLALLVIAPKPKKGFELRHAIAFDPAAGKGGDDEAAFVDTMRDYYTVNRRLRELTDALAALDQAKDEAGRKAAVDALREVLARKPELKNPKNDTLLAQHVAPLEQRAENRLAEAGKIEPPKDSR